MTPTDTPALLALARERDANGVKPCDTNTRRFPENFTYTVEYGYDGNHYVQRHYQRMGSETQTSIYGPLESREVACHLIDLLQLDAARKLVATLDPAAAEREAKVQRLCELVNNSTQAIDSLIFRDSVQALEVEQLAFELSAKETG